MSRNTDKYRNPDAPPWYRRIEELNLEDNPISEIQQNPDAPEGLYRFEMEEPGSNKIYLAAYDFVVELDIPLKSDPKENLSDFIIQTSDEDSKENESEEGEIKERRKGAKAKQKKVKPIIKVEINSDSDNSVHSSRSKKPKKHGDKRLIKNNSSTRRRRKSSFSLETISSDEEAPVEEKSSRRKRPPSSKRRKRSSSSDLEEGQLVSIKQEPVTYVREVKIKQEPVTHEREVKIKQEPGTYESVKIKDEPIEEPQFLYGSYFCEVCNINMNSELTYQSHVTGKRHLKAVKARNIPLAVAQTIVKTEADTRFPKPPAGAYRKKMVGQKAIIQDVIEEKLEVPCPGLENIVEIQGLTETSYYCHLCDSPCSVNNIVPHLSGFKHQLRCIQHFLPDLYEKCTYQPKNAIIGLVYRNLKMLVKRHKGMGKIEVQKELYTQDGNYIERHTGDINQPSTSSQGQSAYPNNRNPDIPDTSKSGFYCRICESHMNSEGMWENHVNGKRHAANRKKLPGSVPSKLKYVPVKGARAYLMDLLDDVPPEEPIVGLEVIKEMQNPENRVPSYQCYICPANLPCMEIVEHILNYRHRRNYLYHIKHPDLELLDQINISGPASAPLVIETCFKVQAERGTGKPEVLVSKSAFNQ